MAEGGAKSGVPPPVFDTVDGPVYQLLFLKIPKPFYVALLALFLAVSLCVWGCGCFREGGRCGPPWDGYTTIEHRRLYRINV